MLRGRGGDGLSYQHAATTTTSWKGAVAKTAAGAAFHTGPATTVY